MAKDSVTSLLKDLVAIPSVNPTGNPGTPHVNERRMALHLKEWTARAGAASRLQAVLPDRPNVLAVWKPQGPVRTRLWFAPHTDTVSVAGMTVAPFTPVVRGGKLYGRGASDTKGPMAAMLWAIAEWWKDGGQKRDVEVTFAGLMGEEAGNDGARALAATRPRHAPDLVIVGEPTDLRAVTAHKGALWVELHGSGKACHASTPERGRNAIDAVAACLAALRAEAVPRLARKPHRLLGPATLNVGTIRGGSKVNIVADACVAELDLRTTPTFGPDAALAELRRVVRRFPGCRIVEQKRSPGLATDPQLPLVQRLAKHGKGIGGVPWFCDAAVFAERGWPAVAFGPGSIAQAHTRDEFIRLSDLDAGVEVLRNFLGSFL